jgi:hypothetical protein
MCVVVSNGMSYVLACYFPYFIAQLSKKQVYMFVQHIAIQNRKKRLMMWLANRAPNTQKHAKILRGQCYET